MDRRNGLIYLTIYLLTYLSTPVFRMDVVQAGLCDQLGASATVANLPASAMLFGALLPVFLAWLIPHHADKKTVVWANSLTAASAGVVCLALCLPFSAAIQTAFVVGQGLVVGFTNGTSFVYLWQCLGRGISFEGRAKVLGLTYSFGPLCAVVGSLGAQFVVGGRLRFLHFPYDFALLYLLGVPVMGTTAFLASRFTLAPIKDEKQPPLHQYLLAGARAFIKNRSLGLAWIGYLLWNATLSSIQNLTLFSKVAMNREPATLVGLMMALRFGGKSINGYVQGQVNLRWGMRAPVVVSAVMVTAAVLWGWTVHGYLFLIAFVLMGAGELGGVYYPNYAMACSLTSEGARNISVLQLTSLPVSVIPVVYGLLVDRSGFGTSFLFATVAGLAAIALALKLPVILVKCEKSNAAFHE